jgi:NAD(P)-dependent dehydrogenase (short-subunit alcohol dehydrogenase family)
MMDRFDAAGDLERSMWDKVIALNLTAPTMVTKRAVNHMVKHEIKGAIVNSECFTRYNADITYVLRSSFSN